MIKCTTIEAYTSYYDVLTRMPIS